MPCQLRKPVRDRDEGFADRNGREYVFPNEGSMICPAGKFIIFKLYLAQEGRVLGVQYCHMTWYLKKLSKTSKIA